MVRAHGAPGFRCGHGCDDQGASSPKGFLRAQDRRGDQEQTGRAYAGRAWRWTPPEGHCRPGGAGADPPGQPQDERGAGEHAQDRQARVPPAGGVGRLARSGGVVRAAVAVTAAGLARDNRGDDACRGRVMPARAGDTGVADGVQCGDTEHGAGQQQQSGEVPADCPGRFHGAYRSGPGRRRTAGTGRLMVRQRFAPRTVSAA